MKLSQWAKQQGLCYRTAWNVYHAGKLGIPAKHDQVEDMVSILTSFCARFYGKRSAKHRAERMLAAGAEQATKKE